MKTIYENSSDSECRGRRARRGLHGHGPHLAAALLGIALLPSLATFCPSIFLSDLSLYVTANPVALRPSEPPEGHFSGDFLEPADSDDEEPPFDDLSNNYPSEDFEETDNSTARRLSPRSYVYNKILKRYLYNSISAPRTAAQGLDIGSGNGNWAFTWSGGNPRLVQWNTLTSTVRNRWFLLRKPLSSYGCGPMQTSWVTTGEAIYVKCGLSTLLRVYIGTATVKARSVTIDNWGGVRFYGPKPLGGNAPLLLTILPTTANYTGMPAANLKFIALKSTTSKTRTRTKTSTSQTRTRTRTRTKTTPVIFVTIPQTTATYPRTVTPTWNPINTILDSSCRYLPVPYVLPNAASSKSTVFNIELISCAPNTDYDATFVSAAQKWMSIITRDVEDWLPDYGAIDCGYKLDANGYGTQVATCNTIDDLIITFNVVPIDGESGILGAAGPDGVRGASGWVNPNLPFFGSMMFDSADWTRMINNGYLEAVVMHEMGHVLGLGTVWTNFDLVSPYNCDYLLPPPTPKFVGTHANSSLKLIDRTNYLNLGYVPLEDTGGNGTRCSHWKESYLKQEIMTGWVSRNGNPLSYLTAYSLMDIGYTVNLNSPVIDKTFDVATAAADPRVGGKGEEHIGDCLKFFDRKKVKVAQKPGS